MCQKMLAAAFVIAVIEDGCITGTGSHHELLESHALYRKLADQQFKGETLEG